MNIKTTINIENDDFIKNIQSRLHTAVMIIRLLEKERSDLFLKCNDLENEIKKIYSYVIQCECCKEINPHNTWACGTCGTIICEDCIDGYRCKLVNHTFTCEKCLNY